MGDNSDEDIWRRKKKQKKGKEGAKWLRVVGKQVRVGD
jgi:hypothetical protein